MIVTKNAHIAKWEHKISTATMLSLATVEEAETQEIIGSGIVLLQLFFCKFFNGRRKEEFDSRKENQTR